MSIYPEVQDRIRPILHRKVFPRMDEARHQPYCMIMWTRTYSMKGAGWEPNHFVPCFDATGSKSISKQSSSCSHSHNDPAVNSRSDQLNSAKSLMASDFYSRESRNVPTKPLDTNVGNPSADIYTTSSVHPSSKSLSNMDTFESVSLSSLKPSISESLRIPIDVFKSCTWINTRQEYFAGSLATKDDKDEVSTLMSR